MVIKKQPLPLLIVSAVLILLCFTGCQDDNERILDRLMEMSEFGDNNVTPYEIEEMNAAVSQYRDYVDDLMFKTERVETYYKMLALAYMDLEMYGPAYDSLLEAVRIDPNNPKISYFAAICSAKIAKATVQSTLKAQYLQWAEQHYLNAISNRKDYSDALYGLSVLYVFELKEPLKAEPHIQHLITRRPSDMEALFVLTHILVAKGDIVGAAAVYDQIIEKSTDPEQVIQAEDNKAGLLGAYYGDR